MESPRIDPASDPVVDSTTSCPRAPESDALSDLRSKLKAAEAERDALRGAIEQLTDRIEELQGNLHAVEADAEAQWQPIATAPKDGTLILGALIRDGKVWRVHDMQHNGLAFYTVNGGSLPQMTHWMPLPSPPPR